MKKFMSISFGISFAISIVMYGQGLPYCELPLILCVVGISLVLLTKKCVETIMLGVVK